MKLTIINAIQALIPNVSVAISSDINYSTGWDFPHAKSVFTDQDNNPVIVCWENYTESPLTQEQIDVKLAELITEVPLNECKAKAKELIAKTDWSALPDVEIVNASEFLAYRANLRALILNPSPTPDFGVEPTPIWS